MWGNAFLLAVRQIRRNPMRSLLTVLGIVIGVAAVITMVTIGNGATQAVRQEIESFGSNQLMLRPGQRMGPGGSAGAPSFKVADVEAIESQIAGVVAVAPQVSKSTTVIAQGKNWSTSVIGTSNDYFTIDNRDVAEGRLFEEAEEKAGSAVCVIGETVRKELWGAASPVGQMMRVSKFSCRVVGVLQEKGSAAMGGDKDDLVVIPFNTASRRLVGHNRVSTLLVSISEDSDRDSLKASLRQLMRERRSLSSGDADNFMIHDTAEIAEKVASTTQIMTALLGAVAAVSLLVGGIGIMNIMYVSVTERTREIGLRMSIGAKGRDILAQFLIESILISVTGGVIGILVGVGAAVLVNIFAAFPIYIQPWSVFLSFAVCTLTGIFFGWYPAQKAAMLNPIDALRYE